MRILVPSSEIRLDLCADCGIIYIASLRHAVVRYIVLDRGHRKTSRLPHSTRPAKRTHGQEGM